MEQQHLPLSTSEASEARARLVAALDQLRESEKRLIGALARLLESQRRLAESLGRLRESQLSLVQSFNDSLPPAQRLAGRTASRYLPEHEDLEPLVARLPTDGRN